ncbi:MAG: ABC transporter permease [Acidimicrobiales bacterium]
MAGLKGRRVSGPVATIWGALIVLLVLSQLVVSSHFFDHSSLSVLTPLVGIMAVVTIGQSIVIGTGGIDLSVAAVVTLVGQIVLKQSQSSNSGLVGALAVCLIACMAIGLINGLLIEGLRLNALVVTLAVGEFVTGITTVYRGQIGQYSNVPSDLARLGSANVEGVSYLLLAALAVTIFGTFFVHRMVMGRRLVLSSAQRRTALLVGVRANSYRVLAYVAAACLYGLGGVLAAGQVQNPNLSLGTPYLLATIAAAVLGGAALTGGRVSMVASLGGAAFLTILDYDLEIRGYSSGVETLAQGVALVVALIFAFSVGRWSTVRRRSDISPKDSDELSAIDHTAVSELDGTGFAPLTRARKLRSE